MSRRTLVSWVVLACSSVGCGDDAAPPAADTGTTASAESTGDGCDVDGDGFRSVECGGTDCDDTNPDINPEASDAAWVFGTVDAALLGDAVVTGMAIDGAGHLHAIYSDGAESGDQVLWHAAQQADETWTTQQIMTAQGYATPSVVTDAAGDVHVLLTVTSGDATQVQHAVLQAGSWTTTTLGDGTATPQALAFDAAGVLVAVTTLEGESSYWTWDGTAWTSESIGAIEEALVVLGPDGAMRAVGRAESVMQVCERDETEWTCSDITAPSDTGEYGFRSRAAHDPTGTMHVVSIDNVDTERLVHREQVDDSWKETKLTFLPSPLHGYSLVAREGTLYVAAWSEPLSTGGLSYAEWNDGEWMLDEIVIEGDRNGWEPSMVVDASGTAHVVFTETIQDDLLYGRRIGSDGIDQDCDGVDD